MKIIYSLIFFALICSSLCEEIEQRPAEPLNFYNLTGFEYEKTGLTLDADLQEDLDEVELSLKRIKTAACLLIIRNSLEKGNTEVKSTLKETKHDKEKTFNKIKAMMLDSCVTKIDEKTVEKVLNPKEVETWDVSYEELIQFNKNVFQIIGPEIKYDENEKKIIEDIEKIIREPVVETPPELIEVDYMTKQFGIYKYMLYGMTAGFLSFGVMLLIRRK